MTIDTATLLELRRWFEGHMTADLADAMMEIMPGNERESSVLDAIDGVRGRLDAGRRELESIRTETAAEFTSVRTEMATEFASVRAEMATEFASVRTDIANMRAEMVTLVTSCQTSIARWMLSVQLTTIIAIVGLLALIE